VSYITDETFKLGNKMHHKNWQNPIYLQRLDVEEML